MAKQHARTPRTLRTETIKRRNARVEAERDLLLDTAATIFGNRGYHEASMREIAEQAGFSVGAVYQRFDSKDALYCEVVQKLFGAIWAAVDRILQEHLEFMPRLLALTAAIFQHYTAHRAFLRLYGVHPPTIAEPYQSRIAEMQAQQRTRRAIVDTLREGRRIGVVGDEDVEFLGSMFVGMINRAVTDYLTSRGPLPEPERLVALFLKGARSSTEASRTADRQTRRVPARSAGTDSDVPATRAPKTRVRRTGRTPAR